MGYLNSASKTESPSYAGDGTIDEDAGETAADEKKMPAWQAALKRMGSGAPVQSQSKNPWYDFGANMTTAIASKFRPKE